MSCKKNIWVYWENAPGCTRPGYIDLCYETLEKFAPEGWKLVQVTRENVTEWLPELPRGFDDIYLLAHKADYVRCALLCKYGGVWCDSDTLAVGSLDYMTRHLASHKDVFYGYKPCQPSIGIFASHAQSPLISRWFEKSDAKVRSGFTKGAWASLGYHILWPLAKVTPYYQLNHLTSSPVHWTKACLFARKDVLPKDVIHPCTRVLSLFNKNLGKLMGSMTADEIMQGDSLVKKLVTYARESE